MGIASPPWHQKLPLVFNSQIAPNPAGCLSQILDSQDDNASTFATIKDTVATLQGKHSSNRNGISMATLREFRDLIESLVH